MRRWARRRDRRCLPASCRGRIAQLAGPLLELASRPATGGLVQLTGLGGTHELDGLARVALIVMSLRPSRA